MWGLLGGSPRRLMQIRLNQKSLHKMHAHKFFQPNDLHSWNRSDKWLRCNCSYSYQALLLPDIVWFVITSSIFSASSSRILNGTNYSDQVSLTSFGNTSRMMSPPSEPFACSRPRFCHDMCDANLSASHSNGWSQHLARSVSQKPQERLFHQFLIIEVCQRMQLIEIKYFCLWVLNRTPFLAV